jgi:hypothetical protein
MAEAIHRGDRTSELTRGSANEYMRSPSSALPVPEDAQSLLLGALMITGIVITASLIYIAINAPIETKECEFQHAATVAGDFLVLKSNIVALTGSSSAAASVSVPITLAPTKTSLIGLPVGSGTLRFSPTTEQVSVRVTESGTGTSGVWTDEDFTNTTTFKVNTSSGNATLAGPPYARGYLESNLNGTQDIGNHTGSENTVYQNLSWNTTLPSNTRIVLKVRSDMFPNMTHARNWSDCPGIESRDGFNIHGLAEVSSVSPGHRYVQYRAELSTWDPNKTPTLLNVSISYFSPLDGVVLATSAGAITFASNYHYLPNNVLSYENGAVIKSQGNEGLLLCNWSQPFQNESGVPSIDLSLIDMTSPLFSPYSGEPVVTLRLFLEDYNLIADPFYYPNITLNITTNYPYIWKYWLNKTLKDAQLTTGYDFAPPVIVNNSVKVVFYGHEHGVKLYLDKTTVRVRMTT